jgi:hypothetical protein
VSSTAKKVIVRRFERESLTGFVNPPSYLQPTCLELLKPEGTLALLPYEEIKSVCFVSDFDAETEPRRIFMTRPKLEGVWVRMFFRDGEMMDGILPNNPLSWEIAGFTVTPPEPDSNNQRVFVPRSALRNMQVLGVVGSPLRAGRRKAKGASEDQQTLF